MEESESVEDSCGFSVCVLAVSLSVLVVTVVLVSHSLVSVLGENFTSGSDCEFVETQSFSLIKVTFFDSQGGTSIEDTLEEVPPITRRKNQEVNIGVDHGWAVVYQTVAKRMLDYLNKCEGLKVDVQELEFHVLAQNEPNIDVKRIVMQARGERHQRLFHASSQQGANEVLVASVARWDERERMLIILEQRSHQLCQANEQISERQEPLAAQMEWMKIL